MPPSTAIQHVVIHNLHMDNNWDAHTPSNPNRATLDDFTRKLLVSGYFSKSAQYGVVDAFFTGSDQAIAAHELIEAATDPNGLAWGTVALTLGETDAATPVAM